MKSLSAAIIFHDYSQFLIYSMDREGDFLLIDKLTCTSLRDNQRVLWIVIFFIKQIYTNSKIQFADTLVTQTCDDVFNSWALNPSIPFQLENFQL